MSGIGPYRPREIEARWQEVWQKTEVFHAEAVPSRPKWFVMDLPPFANGSLHLGHVRNYAIGDASARFHRQLGYSVLYPSGFDTFGLPSESAAAAEGCHPKALTDRCVESITGQFVRLGLSHDPRRITDYCIPEFYRWVQWVFVTLWRNGYAYRADRDVNWCAHCETTVEDGLVTDAGGCWRCGEPVETRSLEQWFVRETAVVDEVLATLDGLDGWSKKVKDIQRRLVGRAEGVEVTLDLADGSGSVTVFEAEPALLDGARYVAVSRDHPLAARVAPAALPERRRVEPADGPKHGHAARRGVYADVSAVPVGVAAVDPASGRTLPVVVVTPWTNRHADAAFGVPGARSVDATVATRLGLDADAAAVPFGAERVVPAVRYVLRDWQMSCQRYWGAPVPAVHCPGCGPVPVPDDELPVLLPLDVDTTRGTDNALAHDARFRATTCPSCGGPAERDTDTLGAYSSPWWYTWCAMQPGADDPFTDPGSRSWQPVDLMVGGLDQSTTCFFHLRTTARMLAALGVVDHVEPVTGLLAIGMLQQDGVKMSKSGANAVTAEDLVAEYGADALRLAVLGAAAPGNAFEWSMQHVRRRRAWLGKVWDLTFEVLAAAGEAPAEPAAPATKRQRQLDRAVSAAATRVTSALHRNAYHFAIAELTTLYDRLADFRRDATAADAHHLLGGLQVLVQLLGPLAPHVAEELWSALGGETPLASGGWPSERVKES